MSGRISSFPASCSRDDDASGVGDEVQVLGDPGESGWVSGLTSSASTEGDNTVLVVDSTSSLHDQGAARVSLNRQTYKLETCL